MNGRNKEEEVGRRGENVMGQKLWARGGEVRQVPGPGERQLAKCHRRGGCRALAGSGLTVRQPSGL